MTSDQAIEIFGNKDGFGDLPGAQCAKWIDVFAALGMLKLDEPRIPVEAAVEAMFARCNGTSGMLTPRHAIQAIRDAGLKIVEK